MNIHVDHRPVDLAEWRIQRVKKIIAEQLGGIQREISALEQAAPPAGPRSITPREARPVNARPAGISDDIACFRGLLIAVPFGIAFWALFIWMVFVRP